jgi:hypothetical protein
LSRRGVVAGAGGVLLGGGTLAVGTREAAAVTIGDIETSGGDFEAASVAPVLDATVEYEYEVETASDVTVWIAVDGDRVSETELYTSSASASNDVSMSAPVLDSGGFTAEDFSVEPGAETTVSVPLSVGVAVFDGGREQARAEESTRVDVSVVHPEDAPATASVGAVIEVVDGS